MTGGDTRASPSLPLGLSPDQALLRLHAHGLPGLVLLESLGQITAQSRLTLLSAAPVQVQHTLPQRPSGHALFPAWIGGLKYEAAREWGLPTHPPQGHTQHWGWYPSGLVWDREAGTLAVVGAAHLDWAGLLSGPCPETPQLQVGPFSPDDLDYPAGVRAVQQNILAGEVYQVNLSRGVTATASGQPLAAYLRLRLDNPSPYMVYAELACTELEDAHLENEVIVSCSPERLVRWQGDAVSARPIAGTRARGDTPAQDAALEAELLHDPKEAAEHLMLTDLLRHDLGWLSCPGSVHVPEYRSVERYSHVMHLVSEVQGRALPGLDTAQLLRATFPGGTITGAPKARVMQEIAALEVSPRGWYTGSFGLLSGAKAELNILIRTAVFQQARSCQTQAAGWTVSVRAGAGVVMASDPLRETRETALKAQALLEVLSGERQERPRQAQSVTPGLPWSPPPLAGQAMSRRSPLRVLLLDNHDSFTQNLAHDLAAHGAAVLLRPNTASLPELLALRPDAVLTGPGPGTPQTSGVTLPLTRACLELGWPLLGVCLGHQALGEALGGRVVRAAQALHGMPEQVRHSGQELFAGVPQGAVFTRYHSLILERRSLEELILNGLPGHVHITATSRGGEVMAIQATHAPAWGVQFHPESLLSAHGRTLLGNWLKLAGQVQAERARAEQA